MPIIQADASGNLNGSNGDVDVKMFLDGENAELCICSQNEVTLEPGEEVEFTYKMYVPQRVGCTRINWTRVATELDGATPIANTVDQNTGDLTSITLDSDSVAVGTGNACFEQLIVKFKVVHADTETDPLNLCNILVSITGDFIICIKKCDGFKILANESYVISTTPAP